MTQLPPAVEQIVNSVYPVPRQMVADQLASISRILYFVFIAFELAFLLWFYYTGLSARVRNAIEASIRNPLLSGAAFIAMVFLGLSLVMLPLTYYASFVLPHQFELSAETFGRWIRDWSVSVALSAAIVAVVGAFFVRTVARFRSWPIIAIAGAAALLIFGSAIYPVFIAPLFNKFTPLPPSPLTRAILKLAAQQGLDAAVVYEYNMSLQTREANAYVAGLGKTERIAVGDTLLHGLKPDEVLFVMAHEIGHYKLGHLWLGTFEAWVGAIVAIALIATLGARLAGRDRRLSRDLSDPAAVPLIAALLILFQVLTLPVANALSRNIEHAADVFAAQHTSLGNAGVRAQARLASQDLAPLHPSRLVVWYFYSHPPTDQRILDAARAEGLAH
ncbi:MAG TPA: M48 family metallopeptidase [Candidatus Eremiobacteraceae bacterium]|nr:M48 family metallopeptidase [Candidatus Eremiobacteraceae bacterium]